MKRRDPTPGISGEHEPLSIRELLIARPLHAVVDGAVKDRRHGNMI